MHPEPTVGSSKELGFGVSPVGQAGVPLYAHLQVTTPGTEGGMEARARRHFHFLSQQMEWGGGCVSSQGT